MSTTKEPTIPISQILDAASVREHAGGISPNTLRRWRTDSGFPEPVVTLPSGTELWHRADVDTWLASTSDWRRRRRR